MTKEKSATYQIPRSRIQYRIAQTFDYKEMFGIMFLIYIDARTAHEGLDTIGGVGKWGFNWERVEGIQWAVKGILKVNGQEYSDVGYPNDSKMINKKTGEIKNVDSSAWLKDAVSDALKRTAVQVGVGRELYEAPDLKLYSHDWNKVPTGFVEKKQRGNYENIVVTKKGEEELERIINDWYHKVYEEKDINF